LETGCAICLIRRSARPDEEEQAVTTDVERIRTETLIVKGHYDIYAMVNRYNQGNSGMLARDVVPKMTAVGANILVAAVSGDTDSHLNGSQRPLHSAMELWDFFLRECQAAGSAVSIIRRKADVPLRAEPGRLHIVLALEGGKPFERNLAHLRNFYRLGMRVLGMSHDIRNDLVDGRKEARTGGGLSRLGVAVVKEANRLGILLDVSHIADPGFFHVLEVSTQPIVASHANVRAVYNHPRNFTDEQLRLLADKGGVLGLVYIPRFIGHQFTPIEGIVAHLEHAIEVMGIDHVAVSGLGSDQDDIKAFEGAGWPYERIAQVQAERPKDIDTRTQLGRFIEALLQRSYARADIDRILGGNMARVMREVFPAEEVLA
jgi:membrane dipeptidase